MDRQIRESAFLSRYGSLGAPNSSMTVYDADEGLARMAAVKASPEPLQLGPGPSFGAGSAEELRPRPPSAPDGVSDDELAAMFLEEAAKLGLVKQNRRPRTT